MKKIYILLAGFLIGTTAIKAQDTLLFENFQYDMTSYLTHTLSPPPGNTIDAMWYDYDADQLIDGSPSSRPGDWWQSVAFSDADLYTAAGFPDTNVVMTSSSWFSSPALADNWLITSNIKLGAHDTLFFKSAPYQTPYYVDGYEVKISTTTNEDVQFLTVLKTAGEYLSRTGTNDSIFGTYSFSSGFIHGQDGTFTEYHADSSRLVGQLRPFKVPLDAYANKNVFLAFHHNSFDDNLISIDDIMVRGTPSNPAAGINEYANDLDLQIFPNPASESAQVNYNLSAETTVTINVFDVTGKLVASETKGAQPQGRHFAQINTSSLGAGFYTVSVQTNSGRSTSKLIVR